MALTLQYHCLRTTLEEKTRCLSRRVCEAALMWTENGAGKNEHAAWNRLLKALSTSLILRIKLDARQELDRRKVAGEIEICFRELEEVEECLL